MTKQDGLSASGHLLLAEGHLRKAEHRLGQTPDESLTAYMAGEAITRAILATRHAGKLLKEQKEETQEEVPSPDNALRDDHSYHENPNY